jgi:multicomponent Na+:H+ antiporter subunit A
MKAAPGRSMGLLWVVISGFMAAMAAPPLMRRWPRAAGWLFAAIPAAIFGYCLSVAPGVVRGDVIRWSYPWAPELGLELSFLLDGLSLLWVLLISGIGALILVFAGEYMAEHPRRGRFLSFMLMFMGSMLGVVLADNLLNLYVFWELTTVTSFLLIGFDGEKEGARAAAWRSMMVTVTGGLGLLAGAILLGQVGGSLEMSSLRDAGDVVREHRLYGWILGLMLLAALTKSAQFPFHFWLPGAMAAPTPVSAYLHSSTMVTAGVYLLARLLPTIGGTQEWMLALTAAGGLSVTLGAVLAIRQVELKRLLVYTTFGALGVMVMLLGMGSAHAVNAAMAFLLAHALYKASLFLIAGTLTRMTGEYDARRLHGLRHAAPVLAAVGVVSAAAMIGLPGFLGFSAKEAALKTLEDDKTWLLRGVLTLGAGSYVLVGLLVGVKPFLGPRPEEPPRAPRLALLMGPAVCAAAGLLLAQMHQSIASPLVGAAARASHPVAVNPDLSMWHGFNAALALSAAAVVLGLVLYLFWEPLQRRLAIFDPQERWSFERTYDRMQAATEWLAVAHTRVVQNGYLRVYIFITLLTVGAAVMTPLLLFGGIPKRLSVGPVHLYETGLIVLTLVGALTAALARERLTAIMSLALVGYSVALLFVAMGAPDLAMVQIAIDTMTVIIFALMLYHLPDFRSLSSKAVKLRDLALCAVVGGSATFLLFGVIGSALGKDVAEFYLANSLPEAKGRNVVNVILVDFRALDTLGEATVIAIAALGVTVLLAEISKSGQRRSKGRKSPILQTSAQYMTPFIVIFAAVVLLQGHNVPGGGFLGGLIAAAALALHALAFGRRETVWRLRLDFSTVMGIGLAVMLIAGLAGPALGAPYLTGLWFKEPVTTINVSLGTPTLFDAGIALVVVGVVSLLVLRLVRS